MAGRGRDYRALGKGRYRVSLIGTSGAVRGARFLRRRRAVRIPGWGSASRSNAAQRNPEMVNVNRCSSVEEQSDDVVRSEDLRRCAGDDGSLVGSGVRASMRVVRSIVVGFFGVARGFSGSLFDVGN